MTFWTVLWITVIGGSADGVTFPVLFQTEADCNAARAMISDALKYDNAIECVPSEFPSNSPRPRHRP